MVPTFTGKRENQPLLEAAWLTLFHADEKNKYLITGKFPCRFIPHCLFSQG
jgi:hypothetical protein